MDKRVIVFLLISLAVIVGYDYLLKEFGLLPPPPEQQAEPAPSVPKDLPSPPTQPPPLIAFYPLLRCASAPISFSSTDWPDGSSISRSVRIGSEAVPTRS